MQLNVHWCSGTVVTALPTSDGGTALHLIVMTKSFAAAELLLRKGASIEALCNRSLQLIHYTCDISDVALIQLVLSSGAQIEALTALGMKPLHLAPIQGSEPIRDVYTKLNECLETWTC